MRLQKQEINALLLEIKSFFGVKWFEAECDKVGDIPDPKETHPIIYSYIKTDNFIKKKKSLPGLEIVPSNEMLNVIMLASYLRLMHNSKISDLNGNILEITIKYHFQKRLRNPALFYSALYEIKVACLYLREGYIVHFIHDKKKSPEFFINVNGQKVYIECKRIEKARLDKAGGDTIRKLKRTIKNLIIDKKVGVIIVCPGEISSPKNWIGRKIRQLVEINKLPVDERVEDYYFKIFNASLTAKLPGYNIASNTTLFYENILIPFLDKQMKKYPVSSKDIVSEEYYRRVTPGKPPCQPFEVDGYFGVAFKSLPAIILGIKKSIKKAYRQIPEGGNGIIYVETPRYDASDEEIKEFWRIISKELSSISRINALVLTGRVSDGKSVEHISNVIKNDRSTRKLPRDFKVIPLLDKFVIN